MTIYVFRDALKRCHSSQVWMIWENQRFSIVTFRRINYSWTIWASDKVPSYRGPFILDDLHRELRNQTNWNYLYSNSLSAAIDIEGQTIWGRIIRVEDTLMMPSIENCEEVENIEGEILIHFEREQ